MTKIVNGKEVDGSKVKKEVTIAEAFNLHTDRMKKNKKMTNHRSELAHSSKRSLPVCSANG